MPIDNYEQDKDFSQIPVQQVSSFDPRMHPRVIPMYDHPARQGVALEQRVREIANAQCWWLDKEFVEKKPREQFEFIVNGENFSVYNYGEPLIKKEIESLERVVAAYSQIDDGRVLKATRSIVINNRERSSPTLEGGNQNGRVHEADHDHELIKQIHTRKKEIPLDVLSGNVPKYVEINPQARFNPGASYAGTPGVHPFEATLFHELAHVLDNAVIARQWEKASGWKGSQFDQANPPPTSYGRMNIREDFAESVTIFLLNPSYAKNFRARGHGELADAWKKNRARLLNYIIGDPSKLKKHLKALNIPMEKKTGDRIHLPEVPGVIEYALIREEKSSESKLINIRRLPPSTDQDEIEKVRQSLASTPTPHAGIKPDNMQETSISQQSSQQKSLGEKIKAYIRSLFIWNG